MHLHRRWIGSTLCVTLLAGLAGPGCGGKAAEPRSTVIRSSTVVQMKADDRDRLAGEDAHTKSIKLAGAEVTGSNYFWVALNIFVDVPAHWIAVARGDTAGRAARQMEDTTSSDIRRDGMMKLVHFRFARKGAFIDRYAQIASTDNDYLLRAAAIRALNITRSKQPMDLYIRAMGDARPEVRLEAAKALANIPDDRALPVLVQHLRQDESKDVRIVCADALREFKTLDGTRALVGVLRDAEFGVAWQARQSLRLLTGRDFRYDESQWLEFFSRSPKPFI